MAKTVELHAEIVENDAGDIVMRLKDYGKGANHLPSRKRGVRTKGVQEAEGDPRSGTTEADRGQPALGLARPSTCFEVVEPRIRQSGAGCGFVGRRAVSTPGLATRRACRGRKPRSPSLGNRIITSGIRKSGCLEPIAPLLGELPRIGEHDLDCGVPNLQPGEPVGGP
jgi:hypothetical protein